MNSILRFIPDDRKLLSPLAPLGLTVRMCFAGFRPSSFMRLNTKDFRQLCNWLGVQSLPLIALSAVFIALALTLETVLEMNKYSAQSLSGVVIAQGLLRELGPLTVSLAWAARVTSRVAVEAHETCAVMSDFDFAQTFLFPRWLAGVLMAGPLAVYGLVIGFASAAIFAPFLGVSSTTDFLENSRVNINSTDLIVYFCKLVLVNPTIAVLAGCTHGRNARVSSSVAVSEAITRLFIAGFIVNWFITWAVYQP